MWNEMCDNLHISRSMFERLKYENNDDLIYDTYTERIIDDQEIYDEETRLSKYGEIVEDLYA